MLKTGENLQSAFVAESQANRRYLFFAEKAEKEGRSQIARLFRAVAEAKAVHANNHFTAMDEIEPTEDNLLTCIVAEHHEFTRVYPSFIEQAKSGSNGRAQVCFAYASEVAQIHHARLQEALRAVERGHQLKAEPYFVCQVCGNTVAGEAPEQCSICGAPGSKFKRVE